MVVALEMSEVLQDEATAAIDAKDALQVTHDQKEETLQQALTLLKTRTKELDARADEILHLCDELK